MAGLVDLIVPEKLMAYSFKNYYQRNLWHTLSKTIMLIPFTLSYLHLIAKDSLVAKVQPPHTIEFFLCQDVNTRIRTNNIPVT